MNNLTRKIIDRDEDGPRYGLFSNDELFATINKQWSRMGSWIAHYADGSKQSLGKTLKDVERDARYRFRKLSSAQGDSK